jgi:hypothetical protein
MSRYECEERPEPVTAPRVGCRCRECYRARQMVLDPRLIEIVNDRWHTPTITVSPGCDVVHRALEAYSAGQIEYAALYIEIIKALIKLSDEHFKQAMTFVSRSPFVITNPPVT